MTEFYSPTSKRIALPNGIPFQLRKGIHPLPDALTTTKLANELGIKPVSEMTEAEWTATALTPAQRDEIRDRHGLVEHPAPEPVAEADAAVKPAN